MSDDVKTTPVYRPSYLHRMRLGLLLTISGLLVFLLGAVPQVYGLDRSPVIGYVQIAVFLIGLGLICLGGFISLTALWNGRQISILADIGLRLVATGYVIAVATGMADVFGLGTQPLPGVPLFGPWQEIGVLIGEMMIGVGFLLMIPYRREQDSANTATLLHEHQDLEDVEIEIKEIPE